MPWRVTYANASDCSRKGMPRQVPRDPDISERSPRSQASNESDEPRRARLPLMVAVGLLAWLVLAACIAGIWTMVAD